jgi:hypothetical protein
LNCVSLLHFHDTELSPEFNVIVLEEIYTALEKFFELYKFWLPIFIKILVKIIVLGVARIFVCVCVFFFLVISNTSYRTMCVRLSTWRCCMQANECACQRCECTIACRTLCAREMRDSRRESAPHI